MTMHDFDFDPDDNFANGLPVGREELDDDATVEALVWQLLLLVNPGDEDAALQQFTAYQDAVSVDDDAIEPISRIRDAIDWKAGFHVADDDPATAIDAIAELASRWNLRIDWGVEDPTDDDFLAATDVATLIGVAFDRLREYGYTLWTWDTGTDATAGWMTLAADDEAMRMVAGGLGIDVRIGAA
jgi:hypothetical protein